MQHQIGQAVAGVLSVLQLTAEEHVHPQRAAGVGLGLHRGTVDLQLGDLQLQLIDEVGHEVLAHAACEIRLIQRVHVLVEAAEAVVVAVAFEHKGEVGEPDELDALMEGLGCELGHNAAVLGHRPQLLTALLIVALGGHLLGEVCVAVRVVDQGLHDDDEALPVVLPVQGLDVRLGLRGDLGLALVDVPAVAAVDEVIVIGGIGTGVLLTAADREDAQFLHEGGLLVDLCFREVAEGVALPLGGQSFQLIFLTGQELVGVIGTGIGGVNLVGEPGQHVDEHRASDETGGHVAGQDGIRVDENGAVLQKVLEELRAAQSVRLRGDTLIVLRDQTSTIQTDGGGGGTLAISQPLDSLRKHTL